MQRHAKPSSRDNKNHTHTYNQSPLLQKLIDRPLYLPKHLPSIILFILTSRRRVHFSRILLQNGNVSNASHARQYLSLVQRNNRTSQGGCGTPENHLAPLLLRNRAKQIGVADAQVVRSHARVATEVVKFRGAEDISSIHRGRDEIGPLGDGGIVSEYLEVGVVHLVSEVHRFLIVVIEPLFGGGPAIGVRHSQKGIAYQGRQVGDGAVLLSQLIPPLFRLEEFELFLLDDALHELLAVGMREFEHGQEVTGRVPLLLLPPQQVRRHELLPPSNEHFECLALAEAIVAVNADHATVGIPNDGEAAHVIHLVGRDVAVAQ
mmetsp:Transcript_15346/g.32524  ORF Transcript_15346/g.32524 Transcript_15346/m.32524 type:complete len:319 (+) Transcript_15346:172-1128(+)